MHSARIATWSTELADELTAAGLHVRPSHVIHRVAVLLHEEPLEHVEVSVRDALHQLDGTIAVLTTSLFAVVDLAGVKPAMHDHNPAGDVRVTVVPRRTLKRLEIPEADGDANYNGGWVADAAGMRTWPPYGQIRLIYPDLPVVVLGGANNPDRPNRLDQLVPRLMRDLAGA